MNLAPLPDLETGATRIRMYTRWVPSGHDVPFPRELVVEVRGMAPTIDKAIRSFASIAHPLATFAGFVANVRVGAVEVHVAYDCTPDSEDREIVETFLADETGAVSEGRVIRLHLMQAAAVVWFESGDRFSRLDRALRQYELALREWFVGGESQALSHLYMAVEVLTKSVLRKEMADRGVTEEELAQSADIDPYDPKRPRWRPALESWVRENLIFGGNSTIYQAAKTASDGLEHGFLELNDVHRHALRAANKTFEYVRRSIVSLLDLDPAVADELNSIKPKDVQSTRKIIRGRLLGTAADPAPADSFYPTLEWSSNITSVVRNGSAFTLTPEEKITVRLHPDIRFQIERIEIVGRLEDGEVPVELDHQDVKIVPTVASRAKTALAAATALTDTITTSGREVAVPFPQALAFNLFGQGLSFFESAQVLVNDKRPIEALPLLRGLALIASYFEAMADPEGVGAGLAARIAIDSAADDIQNVEEVTDFDPAAFDLPKKMIAGWEQAAKTHDVPIPDAVPPAEDSRVFNALKLEMLMADQAINATYGVTGYHVRRGVDDEHMQFHTQIEPGPLTELVASGCVIAQLHLLRGAAVVLGWSIDSDGLDAQLQAAVEVNEMAANPPTVTVS